MRRWIPWIDIVVYLAIPFVITIASLTSLLFEQPWPDIKIYFIVLVPTASWVVAFGILGRIQKEQPTFVTALGTKIWSEDIQLSLSEVTDAILFYAHNIANAHAKLDLQLVISMFSRARIEFTEDPIWWAAARAGVQSGYSMRVHWDKGFGHNAFFHECHHMVDEVLLGRAVDYKHGRTSWWAMIPRLKQQWLEGAKSNVPGA